MIASPRMETQAGTGESPRRWSSTGRTMKAKKRDGDPEINRRAYGRGDEYHTLNNGLTIQRIHRWSILEGPRNTILRP